MFSADSKSGRLVEHKEKRDKLSKWATINQAASGKPDVCQQL
jgi:hypothetical protein